MLRRLSGPVVPVDPVSFRFQYTTGSVGIQGGHTVSGVGTATTDVLPKSADVRMTFVMEGKAHISVGIACAPQASSTLHNIRMSDCRISSSWWSTIPAAECPADQVQFVWDAEARELRLSARSDDSQYYRLFAVSDSDCPSPRLWVQVSGTLPSRVQHICRGIAFSNVKASLRLINSRDTILPYSGRQCYNGVTHIRALIINVVSTSAPV